MRFDVDEIDDIKRLREIAKFRLNVIDRYEQLVDEIVPSSHFVWGINRENEGKLVVLKTYLDVILKNETEILDNLMPSDSANYLARCIARSIAGYEKAHSGRTVIEAISSLSSTIHANLIKNESLLRKWCEYKLGSHEGYAFIKPNGDVLTIGDSEEEVILRSSMDDWEHMHRHGYKVEKIKYIYESQ